MTRFASNLPPFKAPAALRVWRWAILALAGLGAVGATSCTRSGDATAQPALRVQIATEPASLDPTLAEDGASLAVLGNTMEGLVGYDGGGALVLQLADSFQVSPDGLRYEFVLRKEARWSDGAPVAAADFVTAIRRALTAKNGSRLAGMLFPIRGARDFFAGRGKPDALGVREEEGKVVIELSEPTPYFTQVLALPIALPLRRDVLDRNADRWPDSAPSTGPYRLAKREPDRMLLLASNPQYWAGSVEIAEVELRIVNDEAAALNLFEQGRLDVLTRVGAADLPRLRQRPGVIQTSPFLATYYLSFNFRKPPFSDRTWRQAVAGSIRREEIVEALDSGELPARSWVPPRLEGHIPYTDPAPFFAAAVAGAKKKGAPAAALTALYDSSARNTLVMEKVQADLKQALGLKTSLSNLDWKSYLKSVHTDPPPLFRLGILSPILDPIQILEVFTTGSPFNYLKWSDPGYDRLVREIGAMKPGPAREAKIREAQAILVDREAIVVPVYHYVQNHAVGPRVQGFRASPFGVIRFNELKARAADAGSRPHASSKGQGG